MTARIGLVLLHDRVRAVALAGDAVVWAGEAPLPAPHDGLEHVVEALLAQAPLPRWPRPELSAAIGPHCAQVKRIAGLPDVPDPEVLGAIVRESIGTFFLKNGVPLLATGVRPDGAGVVFGAVIDAPCVDAVRAICRRRGWRLGRIAPAAVALPRALADPSFTWIDGALAVEIAHTDATITAVRTRPASPSDSAQPELHPAAPLAAALGAAAPAYAAAYGAAILARDEPLAITQPGGASAAERRRQLHIGGVLLGIGVAATLLSPLASMRAANRSERRLTEIPAERWETVTTALDELVRVTRVLDDLAAFGTSRGAVTPLLGALAGQLPDNTAVLSLELNTDRVELVLVTGDPARALAAVSRMPDVARADLVGVARREMIGGEERQRVTIRLTLGRPS